MQTQELQSRQTRSFPACTPIIHNSCDASGAFTLSWRRVEALTSAVGCRVAAEEAEPAWRAAQLAAQAKLASAAPASARGGEKTEREKQSTRDWILQYAQEDSDSDNGSKQVTF